jgi:putative ATP-dependent endonuclease of OLD family
MHTGRGISRLRVRRVRIDNFRGVRAGTVLLDGHTLLVGGNSVGKSTVCEALDLVLGPERMFRRPVVDEYDFHAARYMAAPERELQVVGAPDETAGGEDATATAAASPAQAPEITIEVVLLDLPDRAIRRFGGHLRKWNAGTNDFADAEPGTLDQADTHEWCLPLIFSGRFNPAEDDFEGGTFFAHPEPVTDDLAGDSQELGGGRRSFSRDDKRHCGYLYLRPNRTGSRALSFQRGSLLDTIIRLEADNETSLWEKLRADLAATDLATGTSLAETLSGVEDRIGRFLALSATSRDVEVYASELTRESIRETLRIFIASKPGAFSVPVNRLSTGSLNVLVFALLTYIAELKGDDSVIFAMEEPEIAIPPHAQRRLVDFVTRTMGQAIVTSHSPYVIERFDPEDILVVARSADGELTSGPVALPEDFKTKRYRENRRQFAEAVLARAVLVVEGATEAAVFPVAADVMDADSSCTYTHLDLAGVSVFNAGNDVSVPLYAPLFKSLGKPVYGWHDTPTSPFGADLSAKVDDFTSYQVIDYSGIEDLLIAEVPMAVKRRFLSSVATRDDYPTACGQPGSGDTDAEVDTLLRKVLVARKGAYHGYASLLLGEANNVGELPASIVSMLQHIESDLASSPLMVPESRDTDTDTDTDTDIDIDTNPGPSTAGAEEASASVAVPGQPATAAEHPTSEATDGGAREES